jgi:hypothetical protein
MSVEVPAKEGQYQHQHATEVLGHYLQDGGRIMHHYTYTVDIETFIRRRLRFCKPSVIQGIRLFPRSRGMRAYVVLTEGHVSAVLRWIKWDCEKRLSGGCQLRVEPSSEGHFGSSPATRTTGWRRSPPELDGGFLAAFSYEKEAEAFLWLLGDDEKMKGWQSEQTTAKGLVSVLLERCGGRERCDSTLATGT